MKLSSITTQVSVGEAMPGYGGRDENLAPGPDIALDGRRASRPGGVTIQVYRPTGRPQYATATATASASASAD